MELTSAQWAKHLYTNMLTVNKLGIILHRLIISKIQLNSRTAKMLNPVPFIYEEYINAADTVVVTL
jgi:hypothetical protein